MIDRKYFFDYIRSHFTFNEMVDGHFHPRGHKLTQEQVDNINDFLDYWTHEYIPSTGTKDNRWLAYIFATTYHETAHTMQPVEEIGHGRGHSYGKPDPVTGQTYYGRGYVQLTWKRNYQKFSSITHEDLVYHPELALKPYIAREVILTGMTKGSFTGKALRNYFNHDTEDWFNARRIINGTDKAALIAGYGKSFLKALEGHSS